MYLPSYNHLASYRNTFLFVFFDLPSKTTQDKQRYTQFRRRLKQCGFRWFQYSVYIRDCATHEIADKQTKKIKRSAPARGHVAILRVTKAQIVRMVNLCDKKREKKPTSTGQLTLL